MSCLNIDWGAQRFTVSRYYWLLSIQKVAFRDWEVAEARSNLDEEMFGMRITRFSEEFKEFGGKMWWRNWTVVGKVGARNEEFENHDGKIAT